MRSIVLIVHDVRSAHNVGSLFRLADGFGVTKMHLTGITPYPEAPNDKRLPHVAQRVGRQIHKTALGAENNLPWEHTATPQSVIKRLKSEDYQIIALEQTAKALPITEYKGKEPVALLVGNEINGLPPRLLQKADLHLQIPMLGFKESHNAAIAASIALYHLRFIV